MSEPTIDSLRRRLDALQEAEGGTTPEALLRRLGALQEREVQPSGPAAFATRGASRVLGGPADLLRSGANLVGADISPSRFGSPAVEAGLGQLGLPIPRPDETASGVPNRLAENMGASAVAVPLLGATAAIPGVGAAVGTLRSLGQGVVNAPLRAIAGEVAGNVGAAVGAEVGQKVGGPAGEAIGTLIGGFGLPLVPTIASITPGTGLAVSAARSAVLPFTAAGSHQRASARVQTMARDPEAAARNIVSGETLPDAQLTPAQLSNDPHLLALEKSVLDTHPKLEERFQGFLAESNAAVRNATQALGEGVSPEAATSFASAKQERVINALRARSEQAGAMAQQRIDAIGPGVTSAQANLIAREEIDAALRAARETENELWSAVPLGTQVGTDRTRDIVQQTVGEMGRHEQLTDMPAMLQRLYDGPNNTTRLGQTETATDLQKLRSRVLDELRAARATDKRVDVRILTRLQEAILTDLTEAGGDLAGPLGQALQFSRTLNDNFHRGPVGRLLGVERDAGQSVPPALTLETALGSGGPAAAVGSQAIRAAAPEAVGPMEDALRNRFLDIATNTRGERDVNAMLRFTRRNRELLAEHPQLRREFEEAIDSQQAFQRTQESSTTREARLRDRRLNRATLYGDNDVGSELSYVFTSRDAGEAMRGVVRMANRDPSGDAIRGVKTAFGDAILDAARTKKLDQSGTEYISGDAMQSFFNNPKVRDAAAALFSQEEMGRWRQIVATARRVDAARAASKDKEGIIADKTALLTNLVAKVTGAQTGSFVAKQTGGGNVQTPGIFAGAARKIAGYLSQDRARNLLVDAVQDPELMSALLTKVNTPRRAKITSTKIQGWLLNEYGEQVNMEDGG